MISLCSSSDSGSSYDISNLADVANVFVAKSGRALPVMHFMILIFVVLSKRLVMLLFQ